MLRPSTNFLQAPTNKGEGDYRPVKDPNAPPGVGDYLGPDDGGPDDYTLQVIDCIRRIWNNEDTIFQPLLQRSLHAYELYNNTYAVDSAKDEWQSRMKMPYCFMTVERWVAALSKLIESGQSWIETDSIVPQLQIFHNLCKNLMMFMLNHDMVRFFPVLREALKVGLLSGNQHIMVTFDVDNIPMKSEPLDGADNLDSLLSTFLEVKDPGKANSSSNESPFIPNPQMPKLVLKTVSSSQVRLDSTGQGRYKMWRTQISVAELRATAVDRGYDLRAVERAVSRMGTEDSFRSSFRNRIETGLNKGIEADRQMVELTHFEGILDDPVLGQRVFKNKYCVVGNGTELVLQPTESPFWDKEPAIVSAPFIGSPGSVYGKSPITEAIDAFYMRHNFQNSLNDYMQRTMNPPIMVNQQLLGRSEATEDLILYPGRRIDIDTQDPNACPVKAMVQPDLPPGLWQYIQFFQTMMGEVTGMTQELMGMPRTRGRITGMEYNTRQSEAGSWIGFVFNDLEDQFLGKLIRVIFLRTLQFMPDAMWKAWVTSNIPRLIPVGSNIDPKSRDEWQKQLIEAAEWTARERYMKLGGFFKFKIRIFSNQAERQMEIEKGSFLLNVLQKIPGAMQAVRLPEIIRYLVRAFGWDPELILNSQFIEAPNIDQASLSPEELIQKMQGMMSGQDQGDLQPPNIVDPTIMDMLGHPGPGGHQPPPSPQDSPFPGGPQQTSPGMPTPPGPFGF